MSKCISESSYLTRYAGSGALNTVAGFAVIFAVMALGFSPYIANITGYLVGFILGFIVSKKFVFRSNGHFVSESIRYLAAFLICFGLNLLSMKIALTNVHALFAQLIAAVVYTGTMYLLTRHFVFSGGIQTDSRKD